MANKENKRLPYGISNFESIMTENYTYVDKTRFVEQLENTVIHICLPVAQMSDICH